MGEPATWTTPHGNVWLFVRTERTTGMEGFQDRHKMWYVDRICKVTRPDGTSYYDYEMIDCGLFQGEA